MRSLERMRNDDSEGYRMRPPEGKCQMVAGMSREWGRYGKNAKWWQWWVENKVWQHDKIFTNETRLKASNCWRMTTYTRAHTHTHSQIYTQNSRCTYTISLPLSCTRTLAPIPPIPSLLAITWKVSDTPLTLFILCPANIVNTTL